VVDENPGIFSSNNLDDGLSQDSRSIIKLGQIIEPFMNERKGMMLEDLKGQASKYGMDFQK
jgi:hypothetical protein